MSTVAHILVIDPDDQVIADYMKLATPHWQFRSVHTFAEALELLDQSACNLIIFDMMLPDVLGTDAWNYFHKLHPEVFGILTTSSHILHASINPGDRGILAYLLKPVRLETLSHLISQGLGMQNAAAQANDMAEYLGRLSTLLSGIMQAATLGETLETVLANSQLVLSPDWLVVSMLNPPRGWDSTRVTACLTPTAPPMTDAQAKVIGELMDESVESRSTVLTGSQSAYNSADADPRPEKVGFGAVMIAPLVANDNTYGALAMVNRIESEPVFTQNEIRLLTLISQVLGFKLDYTRYSREIADRMAQVAVEAPRIGSRRDGRGRSKKCPREGQPSYAVFIGGFSKNGSAQGEPPIDLEALIRKYARRSDVVTRYGEQAYVVLLQGTEESQAQQTAHRLEQAIQEHLAGTKYQLETRVLAWTEAGQEAGQEMNLLPKNGKIVGSM